MPTIAVYGDFAKKDVRLKVISSSGTHEFAFQNILIEAGYDCKLYFVTDDEISGKTAEDMA